MASTHVPLKAGDVVGERYRVVEQLGAGGMGTVYKVEHTLMGKELAMKLLRPELSIVPQIAERFEREARSASKLDNIHIVRVTDFGVSPSGALFLVMELLGGESLSQRIARGAIPLGEALDLMDQILDALEHAHANGVIHRDLKPDNIMLVARDGRTVLKVLDFGLAKMTGGGVEETGRNLTQTGMVFGTPRYMSPEQASSEAMDARTDLYSVGVLLFELLMGRPPFTGATAVDLLRCHLLQEPPHVELPGVPPELVLRLDATVQKAMSKHPQDRFQSAAELRLALAACRPAAAGFEDTHPAAPVDGRPVPAPRRSSPGTSRSEFVRRSPLGFASLRALLASSFPSLVLDTIPDPGHAPPGRAIAARNIRVLGALLLAVGLGLGAILFGGGSRAPEPSPVTRAEEALARGELPAARAILGALSAKGAVEPRVDLLLGHLAFAEGDLDDAVTAYKRALERDSALSGDRVLAVNTKRIIDKNAKLGGTLVAALALQADGNGAALLADLAENAPTARMRSHAFQALDRLGETKRLRLFEYLSSELEKARGESCTARKVYVDRLATLEDPRVLPLLKKERGRRGGFLGLDEVNACMERDLGAYIARMEKK